MISRTLTRVRLVLAAALLAASTAAALSQVPPHTPGSICATPTFWCWAQTYGQVGQACVCPTGSGLVQGYYV